MELSTVSTEIFVFLFCIACLAGFVDTLAGGGGLIVLPALLMSGLPPLFALGTNKLQGTMGTATATYLMLSRRKVAWAEVKSLMLTAFIGSVCGTIAVQFINAETLSFIIPVVLLTIGIYFLFSARLDVVQTRARVSDKTYKNGIIPLIGWYDGMFGPGTGSFFALAGVSLKGQGLIDATARAKTFNFATNISSLLVFVIAGKIFIKVGLLMMAGQLIGAWIGSRVLFAIAPKYLRYLVVLMCAGMLIRYFWVQ